MPDSQTYATHAHVRCRHDGCVCESLMEARGKMLSATQRVLERAAQVCPLCRHSAFQHECLGEIPSRSH